MRLTVVRGRVELAERAAERVAALLGACPESVLALPTGRTPIGMYRRLVALNRLGRVDLSRATLFNLDEYAGVPADHRGSFRAYMRRLLWAPCHLDPARTHVPRGDAADLAAECARYEAAIRACGGIDLAVLGIGANGHIGFNEPGSRFDSRTRVVDLDDSTRRANGRLFEGGLAPARALTMGIGTIIESRSILLLAAGADKAAAVRAALRGPLTEAVPASALQRHPDVEVLLDPAAASRVERDA